MMNEHSSRATTLQMLNAGMHLVVQTYVLAMIGGSRAWQEVVVQVRRIGRVGVAVMGEEAVLQLIAIRTA